jgi:hypothetical protein
LDARVTAEITEDTSHFRGKNMNWPTSLILPKYANSPGLPEPFAFLGSLNQHKPILLVLKYRSMPNMKVLSICTAKIIPIKSTRVDSFFNFEVSDDVKPRPPPKVPAFQSRIKDKQVAFS